MPLDFNTYISEQKDRIEYLIASGDLRDALRELLDLVSDIDPKRRGDVLLLSAQLREVERSQSLADRSIRDVLFERGQAAATALTLIEDLTVSVASSRPASRPDPDVRTEAFVDPYLQGSLPAGSQESSRGGLESFGTRTLGMRRETEESRPIVARLRSPGWDDEIDGLEHVVRLGRILTGTATDAAIRELSEHPNVRRVSASRPAGQTECATSIPWVKGTNAHQPPYSELGAGAIVAIVDAGIDPLHLAFQTADRHSRIAGIWDQRDPAGPTPGAVLDAGFSALTYGTYHSRLDIEGYIAAKACPTSLAESEPHGTHVASIAAGSPIPASGFPGGMAPEADIVVVIPHLKPLLGYPPSLGYSKSHIDALRFLEAHADAAGAPMVVNVSLGMNAGAHDGTSALEEAFDEFTRGFDEASGARRTGRVIVKSAGNENGHHGHISVQGMAQAVVQIGWESTSARRTEDYFEFWHSHESEFRFELTTPHGDRVSIGPAPEAVKLVSRAGGYVVEGNLTTPHPDNGDTLLSWRVRSSAAADLRARGSWTLDVTGHSVSNDALIHGWVERDDARAINFVNSGANDLTLSIPGTAASVVTVGACIAASPVRLFQYSSHGPTRDGRPKPELVAPGADINAAYAGTTDGLTLMSGTSMAAPHVSGAVALLLARRRRKGQAQWNAAQVRTALIQRAQHFSGNYQPGFGHGALDVEGLLDKSDHSP